MPYVITTSGPCGYCTHCGYSGGEGSSECLHVKRVSRVAVATLEEAREHVRETIYSHELSGRANDPVFADVARAWHAIGDSGGTVGPLPDGTIIEVERVTWAFLVNAPGYPLGRVGAQRQTQILTAFNAS